MNRDKHIEIESLELAQPGFANGISTYLRDAIKNGQYSLSDYEKHEIIEAAAVHYGKFLTALGVDWENDPNSSNTPRRVAKAYVNDLWKGRYEPLDSVTSFPSDGYDGVVFEGGIPITSMCSHHHQTINGLCHIAYVPTLEGRVVGLSKLNRIVEHFSRRGAIQEQLTVAIHNAVDKICEDNIGVAVMIEATHNCVSCRGVKHQGASMKTSKLSGCFLNEDSARLEFYEFVKGYPRK
jgi:GTP cyclohydrolase IA